MQWARLTNCIRRPRDRRRTPRSACRSVSQLRVFPMTRAQSPSLPDVGIRWRKRGLGATSSYCDHAETQVGAKARAQGRRGPLCTDSPCLHHQSGWLRRRAQRQRDSPQQEPSRLFRPMSCISAVPAGLGSTSSRLPPRALNRITYALLCMIVSLSNLASARVRPPSSSTLGG